MRSVLRLALLASVAALAACSDATGPRPTLKAPSADVTDTTTSTPTSKCSHQQGSNTFC